MEFSVSGHLESHLESARRCFSFVTSVSDCSGNVCKSQPTLKPNSLLKWSQQVCTQFILSNGFCPKRVPPSSGFGRQTRYRRSHRKLRRLRCPESLSDYE